MTERWSIQYWRKWRNRPHESWMGILELDEWGMREYFIGPFSLVHFFTPRFGDDDE